MQHKPDAFENAVETRKPYTKPVLRTLGKATPEEVEVARSRPDVLEELAKRWQEEGSF